jgi:DNA-binding response OmpR family regulator
MPQKKRDIMLIEDDGFISGMYQTKLSMLGFEVRVAVDGLTGWEELQKKRPDLLLLDIVLPKKDGFEILSDIRKHPDLKDLPVIVLTNLGQKSDVERGLELGADDYVIKAHFTPTEVVEKIERILQKREGA